MLSVLFTGTVASSGLAFLTQIMLARSLAIESVGRLAALLAVVNLLTPIASVSANYFILQTYGREGIAARRWLRPCVALVAIGTSLSVFVLAAYVYHSGGGREGSAASVTAAGLFVLLGQVAVELAAPRFQLEGRFTGLAIWQCVTQAGRFVVQLALLLSGATMEMVLLGYAIVGFLSAASAVRLLAGLWSDDLRPYGEAVAETVQSQSSLGRPTLFHAARGATPFTLMTVFYVVYFQGPIVVLEWLRGGALAGAYNAAFLVIAAFSLIPSVLYMKLLIASICRWAEHDREAFSSAFHVGVPAMTVLGTLCMLATLVGGPTLIPLLFGSRYDAGLPALSILAIALPIRFAQSAYSSLFITHANMVRKVRYLGVGGFIGIAGSVALVPRFGVEGAAWATVIAEAALLVMHVQGVARFIDGVSVLETLRPSTFQAAFHHLTQIRPQQNA